MKSMVGWAGLSVRRAWTGAGRGAAGGRSPGRERGVTPRGGLVVVAALAVYVVVLYRNAWVGDDAFITFRTVENFLHGYGLRWNTGERVQAYTHPLWMLLLAAAARVTGESFHTTMVVSMLLSSASVALVCLVLSRNRAMALLGVTILTLTRAFVDYSTSGLENPLTHVLLGAFYVAYFRLKPGWGKDFWLAFLAGLGTVNRMDIILFFFPVLCVHLLGTRCAAGQPGDGTAGMGGGSQQCAPACRHRGLALFLGFVPLLAWELFSLFYYGFPFPNTYYAKTQTGIPVMEMVWQGIYYLQNSFAKDPLTLPVILAGALVPVLGRQRDRQAISVGIILYLLYVVKVGGCFMSGRFLSAPLFSAVVLLVHPPVEPGRRLQAFLFATVLALGLLSPSPPPFSGKHHVSDGWDAHGITDERGEYFTFNGLLNTHFAPGRPWHPWLLKGAELEKRGVRLVVKGSMGMYCYAAGPRVHCLDRDALAEPLLARIPAIVTTNWRIGHLWRRIPEGYRESLETGVNRIEDPNLRRYYDRLSLVIRGPLLSRERLAAIWAFNTGQLDHLMDAYVATLPEVTKPYLRDEK